MQTEFVRSLQNNYERILLEEKPEENKYQYCILSRGGIKGLLPFSLRYIDGQAYLYYDITSKQSVSQLFAEKSIDRQWLKDFMWSMKRMQTELDRFLLPDKNLLWFPREIFQDLEKKLFYFLYVPYYEEKSEFRSLLEFIVEHVDYEDEILVDCVYQMYERFDRNQEVYLQQQIYEDVTNLLSKETPIMKQKERQQEEYEKIPSECDADTRLEKTTEKKMDQKTQEGSNEEENTASEWWKNENISERKSIFGGARKGLFAILENRKKKDLEEQGRLLEFEQDMTELMRGDMVAEEEEYTGNRLENKEGSREKLKNDMRDVGDNRNTEFEEDAKKYGNTIYIEEIEEESSHKGRLFLPNGKLLAMLEGNSLTIGKKRDEVGLCLEDYSVSRIHARLVVEQDKTYIEDLNSTNGTFKNGLRLQPYEKRLLEQGDEIKCGKVIMIYR